MKNNMNSICRTFRMSWRDMSGLPMCLSCTSCGSGRNHAKFWPLWIHILDFFEILLHFFGLSILCHGFILIMLPSLNRHTPWNTSFVSFEEFLWVLFLHSLKYHTGICCFPMQALNLFITIRCYFMFSATMSHAMPWHCDVVHPTQSTVRAYSTVVVHSQRASSDSRHKGASIETNNTHKHYLFFLYLLQ